MMSRSLHRLPLALALLLALACGEDPVSPDRPAPPGPNPDIVDAGHGTEAPGFYFLPPMAGDPSTTGTFDAELAPVVTICEGGVTECSTPVAEFTTMSGPGSETVRMVAEDEHYVVNWHTDAFDLDPELAYRIVVSVVPDGASDRLVLGYADVALGSTGGELKSTDTGEEVPLKDGRTLPIRFRTETGIVGRLVVEPSQAEIEVGETQPFTGTLYDLHGATLTGPAVTWASGDEAVATVDGTGLATGVSSGTATITATSQRVSDSAALSVATAGLSPAEVAKLLASDGASGDQFGFAVAVDGDVAVIGAPEDSNDNGSFSGSAYVFDGSSGTWTQAAKLTASDGATFDRFGFSVAVSGDVVLIGAPVDDDQGSNSGSAYVFDGSSGTWTQAAKLTASDGASGDRFGTSVAMYGDVAVIGAPEDSNDNGSLSGSAYVFDGSSGTWTEAAKLTASDGASHDRFGTSVATDGDVAVIGAFSDDDNGSLSGSAYVFDGSGGTWTEAAKLTASDGTAFDFFGRSVAVSGGVAVVGAEGDDDQGLNSGSAYVFDGSGGSWTQAAKLTASDGASGDQFGSSVATYGDVAVIGAPEDSNDNGSASGAAYVFDGAGGTWTQAAKLTASDGAPDDWFGTSVATYGDVAVVGAYQDDDNGRSSGSAFLFDLQP